VLNAADPLADVSKKLSMNLTSLESLADAGGWLGRVARIAADAPSQAGQLGSQCGELLTHLLIPLMQDLEILPLRPDLLLLSQDGRPGISRPRQPVGF